MSDSPVQIELSRLDPHPKNPRLVQREDVIEAIKASINGHGFDPAHAIIARPVDDRMQIISGHNRTEAARRAGLSTIVAWVREMDDDTAYMELVRSNAQGELTALERGMHALGGKWGVREYAGLTGVSPTTVTFQRKAAEVFTRVNAPTDLSDYFRHLTEIHAAPAWLWPALVASLVEDGGTVEAVRRDVAKLKDAPTPPEWADSAKVASAVIAGEMKVAEIGRMAEWVDRAAAAITRAELDAAEHIAALKERLDKDRPSRLDRVMNICNGVVEAQAKAVAEKQRAAAAEQEAQQDRERRIASMRSNVSLDQWKELDADTRAMLLDVSEIRTSASFNKQDNNAIEWAQWSWNPVTGCLHDCPYCYARDIANSAKVAAVYPNGFAPSLRPASLMAPRNTKVPKEAATDTRYRNVFTCSMADLFGRWVPPEWINAVLGSVRDAPQWNFLFLTKFPKRMAEFDIPENAWMGTTVDLQARVKNAEAAFSRVTAGVRWLSVEPMLEPLRFNRMDLFQWIVIGGASRSSKTPDWTPPFEWIADLVKQAREAGTKVYFKTNLLGNRVLELPFDAPIKADPIEAPAVFHYLGGKQAEAA